jgi:integrase
VKLIGHRLVFAPPKYGKDRQVPLPDSTAEWLDDYETRFPSVAVTLPWKDPDGGELVTVRLFVTTRERKAVTRTYFNRGIWKPALVKSGVPPTRENGTHALRHLYASVLLDAGESIKAVSEYLGHADPGFTLRIYTHLMPTSAERTRKAIDVALTPADESGDATDDDTWHMDGA